MREIVLDTETTGLDPASGHRIVEVACLELINHIPSGRRFQRYLNPDRDMPEDAYKVHGLSAAFLADKQRFGDVAAELMAFIDGAPLVIHNAEFDMRFLNAELARLEQPLLASHQAVDTLQIARRKFPGSPASLDALCKRFNIDNSARELHGALLDAELLAEVYLELIGGRQAGFDLVQAEARAAAAASASQAQIRPPRILDAPSIEELAAHAALLTRLKEPLWNAG
ncbi:MAG TPA: DNA polymerase III subunit epsilon [Candidatus Polarisedimenticolia bacterium]|nr:DNA polymerase III subunit epsilon [Dongiaceae bacterium]HYV89211.1 DNA polymerase III subunit epsilon [Candidatus Polarisedimenticolia bacterium]